MIPTFDLACSLRGGSVEINPYGLMIWDNTSDTTNMTLSNGDRTAFGTGSGYDAVRTTFVFNSTSNRKLYWEAEIDTLGNDQDLWIGVLVESQALVSGNFALGGGAACAVVRGNGNVSSTTWTSGGTASAIVAGDRMMFAVDEAAGKFWVGQNGTWFNSGDPAAGTGALFTNAPVSTDYDFIFHTDNLAGDVQVTIPTTYDYATPSGFTAI
jgi:hypothetical protein